MAIFPPRGNMYVALGVKETIFRPESNKVPFMYKIKNLSDNIIRTWSEEKFTVEKK